MFDSGFNHTQWELDKRSSDAIRFEFIASPQALASTGKLRVDIGITSTSLAALTAVVVGLRRVLQTE